MSRSEELKKRAQSAKLQKDIRQKELEADIQKKADACRKFVNDKRHIAYKEFWEGIKAGLVAQRDNLKDAVENTDEYVRKGLILDTKIQTISWILNTPIKFVEIDKNIKEKGQ